MDSPFCALLLQQNGVVYNRQNKGREFFLFQMAVTH
jgi:hypothetical protein